MSASQADEKQREQREQWEQFSEVIYLCGSPGSLVFPLAVPAQSRAGTDAHLLAGSTRANWRCIERTRGARYSQWRCA